MTVTQATARYGFELIRSQKLPEISSTARYYRHNKTGAELVSLLNGDENKVFGVSFGTPPADSTGIAHILEHSVLCGSRKYPIKKPFVELMKISGTLTVKAFRRRCWRTAPFELPSQSLRTRTDRWSVWRP
jgi:Zn-dependent M16 (insulinase) family peptidase